MTPTLVAPWLLAARRTGLVAVGPRTVIEVAVSGPRKALVALVDALATGDGDRARAADLAMDDSEIDELRTVLTDAGALADGDPADDVELLELDVAAPLAEVLAATRAGEHPRSCYTAEELLLIPDACPLPIARRALHAFVGGLRPEARAAAYAQVAAHGEGVRGDRPTEVAHACARDLDPSALHVVPLREHTTPVSIHPDELAVLGAERQHRLGVVQQIATPELLDLGGRPVVIARARYSPPNLRFPSESWVHGTATDAQHAELIARAEAAERFAMGRPSGVELRRAHHDELDGAVRPDALSPPNLRQAANASAPGADERLWASALTTDGAPRWVPAEVVLMPFVDPLRPDPWLTTSSSGVAAHLTTTEAARRALLELIERDALMWRWVQRVPPAHLAEAALSNHTRGLLAALRRKGWEVDLVDLTLDLLPVVLCALRNRGRFGLGMGCERSATRAADRALHECLTIAGMGSDEAPKTITDPAEVMVPGDHLALHHDPEHAASHAFLFERDDEVDPRDLPTPPEPLAELLRPIGEVLLVEHRVPEVRPFRVVRALVPGLAPISFGFDREPLGLPRLARPVTTRAGHTIGGHLDLATAGPILPHPFP